MFQLLQIFGIFPCLVIDNAGFGVNCPDYLGYLPVRVEKTWIRLATITLQSKMPKIQMFVSMCELFSGDSWYNNQV